MLFFKFVMHLEFELTLKSDMKVHQLTHGFWEHEPSLSLSCKRFRPLAPKLASGGDGIGALDLKSFIKPESGPRNSGSTEEKKDAPQAEAHSGGTRWNPTQEQIGILERLYQGGMRTPNAQQIEQITAQLGKYGKIEGKNVFYWFQNHKARERQRQKRNCLGLNPSPRPLPTPTSAAAAAAANFDGEFGKEEDSYCKRKCRSWGIIQRVEEESSIGIFGGFRVSNSNSSSSAVGEDGEEQNKTLELFPLHPEGR